MRRIFERLVSQILTKLDTASQVLKGVELIDSLSPTLHYNNWNFGIRRKLPTFLIFVVKL